MKRVGCVEPMMKTDVFYTLPFPSYTDDVINTINTLLHGSGAHTVRLGLPSITKNAYRTYDCPFPGWPTIDDDYQVLVKRLSTKISVETARFKNLDKVI